MCFAQPNPKVPPIPPQPVVPKLPDRDISEARGRERERAALAAGRGSTIMTAGLGLLRPANLAQAKLTGQGGSKFA